MKYREILLLGVLGLTGFVTSFGAYIVAANLPSYSRETGAGLIVIGILIALYDIAELIIKPLGALLSRKTGEWLILRMGLMLFSLASGLYLLLPPPWLILVRLLQGAGSALFSVMSMILIIRHFVDKKGTVLGIYGACKNSGYVFAPTIGGYLVYHHGFKSVFAICLGIGLIVIALTYTIHPHTKLSGSRSVCKKEKKRPAMKDLLYSVKNRQSLPIFLIIFFNMIFMSAFFGFMPVLLSSKGLDPLQTGMILALNAVIYIAVQPLAGRLSDAIGRKKMITFGLTLSTICVTLIPFLGNPFFLGSAFLMALGVGCVSPLGEALVGDMSVENMLALNLGVAGFYRELGELAGPLSMGIVGQTLGLSWAFLMVGMIGLGGLSCLMFLDKKPGPCVC